MYTQRARIFTGTICNARCEFCYYVRSGLKERRTTANIKRQIDIAHRAGMTALDFSGGEPTLIPEITDLIHYARQLGFKTVCIVTNGQKLANKEFCMRLIDAGLNDILFSIHAATAPAYERLTHTSFDKLMRGITHIVDSEIAFRVNCTVTKANYRELAQLARLYVQLHPLQANLIMFNDWETADTVATRFAAWGADVAPYIQEAIDIMRGYVKYINVRYIPFCFMRGYERYVCNYPQKIHDPFEWSQRLLARLNAQRILPLAAYYAYLGYEMLRQHPRPKANLAEYAEDICVQLRRATYIKPPPCHSCQYDLICDGLHQSTAKLPRAAELTAIAGAKISAPLHFRHGFYDK